MTAPLLVDALGPKGRRRVLIASVVSAVALAGLLTVAVLRLADKGQLDAAKWEPLTRWSVLKFLWGGLVKTLEAAAVAMVLAILIGGLMALGRLARSPFVRLPAVGYIEFFRAMPLLLLILFTAQVLPRYGLAWGVFWYLVLALTAYNSAVLGEIFRSGILSLERGQTEASFALGLGYWQTMFSVVIPQAARRMVPAIVSQVVTLLKDTSLGYVIAFEELLRRSRSTGEFFGDPLQAVAFVAVIYIAVNFSLSRLAGRLEVRQRRRYQAGAISVRGVDELAVVEAHADAATATRKPAGPGPRRR
jgi:glutamate transport system permease protein